MNTLKVRLQAAICRIRFAHWRMQSSEHALISRIRLERNERESGVSSISHTPEYVPIVPDKSQGENVPLDVENTAEFKKKASCQSILHIPKDYNFACMDYFQS